MPKGEDPLPTRSKKPSPQSVPSPPPTKILLPKEPEKPTNLPKNFFSQTSGPLGMYDIGVDVFLGVFSCFL